jgi:hypothetical protein
MLRAALPALTVPQQADTPTAARAAASTRVVLQEPVPPVTAQNLAPAQPASLQRQSGIGAMPAAMQVSRCLGYVCCSSRHKLLTVSW